MTIGFNVAHLSNEHFDQVERYSSLAGKVPGGSCCHALHNSRMYAPTSSVFINATLSSDRKSEMFKGM